MKKQTTIDQRTVLTLLDIFGSCVTDVFYNHLYDRAISIHEKTDTSITECYRTVINDYISESESPRFYTVLLNSLHHYVRMSTIYNELSYSDCVTLYVSLFVPQMYIPSMTSDQKVNILTMVIKNTVTEFSKEILYEHISVIIDDHGDPVNVEVLQDSILKILVNERDQSYKRFINSQKPVKQNEEQNRKLKKTVKTSKQSPIPTQALTKLTNAFKKSINERVLLKKKNKTLLSKNESLSKQFKELKQMFLEQLASQKEQSRVIEELKQKLQNVQIDKNDSKSDVYEASDFVSNTYPDDQYEESKSDSFDDGLFSVEYVEN